MIFSNSILSDAAREERIRTLGTLICSKAATRLWRVVCMAEQRQLIRGRSPEQNARMEAQLEARVRQSEGRHA